jgi:hypothetical protein
MIRRSNSPFCSHGMQFSIKNSGYFKWSLVQYVYEQWAEVIARKLWEEIYLCKQGFPVSMPILEE